MRRFFKVALLALPLAALPAPARADCFCIGPFKVNAGVKWWLDVSKCGCSGGCGITGCNKDFGPFPWYVYWPAGADAIGAPTPACYPYWPAANAGYAPTPLAYPTALGQPHQQVGFQPAGYGEAPNYWYGK